MFSYDLPYKNCHWRTPSFLLLSDQNLYDHWHKVLTELKDSALILVYIKDAKEASNYDPRYEPFMKTCGQWRAMGAGRKFTTEEVLGLDMLVGLDLIKQRFYVPVNLVPPT